MAEYSKIKSLTVTNFMSHAHTRVEFDESNIIDLCGYNDSGKTALEYALDVLFYDGSPTLQASYIKEGEDYFKVAVDFVDGVCISKTKDKQGKSVWVMEQNGTVLYTNQKDTEVIATDGVPQAIAKYLGVVYDEATEQKLNLRTKRDKALLTETTGGENYKMLSTVCNSEVLSEASNEMTAQRNKLNSAINTKTTELAQLESDYAEIETPPIKVVDALAEQLNVAKDLQNRNAAIEQIVQAFNDINGMVIQPAIDNKAVVDGVARLEALNAINDCVVKMKSEVYPEIVPYDVSRLTMLCECMRLNKVLVENTVCPEVQGVDANKLAGIVEVIKAYNALLECQNRYMVVEQQYKTLVDESTAICKQNNIRICKNCGAAVMEDDAHEHV